MVAQIQYIKIIFVIGVNSLFVIVIAMHRIKNKCCEEKNNKHVKILLMKESL